MITAPSARYGSVAQGLHWMTAVLVLVAFVFGPGGSEQRVYLPARDFERQLHETLGLCVFALSVIRVLWKMVDARPAAAPLPRWMETASRALQGVLYLLLFLVPMTAMAGAWLEGHPLTLLAGVQVKAPMAMSHALGVTISDLHTWLGDALIWLAGAHACAAIYHHLILKDGVLRAMLPRWLAA